MLYQRKGGFWRLTFSFRGKRHFLAFGRVSREQAQRKADEALSLLQRVRKGELILPEGMNISTFLFMGGITPDEHRQIQELNRIPGRFGEPYAPR
jgi:hypothetical protein